ncbi:1-aminocyclopropane-1-carboxylate deaminase/D-cysteine desulfhydrase [Roseivirga sp.]|uniref:1-aminocyclopropane-1-carboxylate deaminase/D-cysteine desulfhydrase n=1 Tax=Roseivirga sp. TaxID=1964215 RepID=UPI003B526AA8
MDFSQINEQPKLQVIHHPDALSNDIDLQVLRLDETHPHLSGNKWYKLKYNLLEASRLGHNTLLTFGGAYSNHIHAVASAARLFGFRSIGIIRGEAHATLNPTLSFAIECGMQLKYVDRTTYRDKTNSAFLDSLKREFGDFYLIPEGGTNELAIKGASEILHAVDKAFDYYFVPVGTGGTITGLINSLNNQGRVIGVSALKGSFLQGEVTELLNQYTQGSFDNWLMNNNYHFGGYAKVNPTLIDFIRAIENDYQLPLEPIYTGKMLFGIIDMISREEIPKGSKVLAIHTGGLQGRAGFGL